VQTNDLNVWTEFMRGSITEMKRVLRPGGVAVIEVGEVRYGGRLVNLDEIIVELGRQAGLSVVEVLINSSGSPSSPTASTWTTWRRDEH